MSFLKVALSLGVAMFLYACVSTPIPTPNQINAALAEVTGQNGRACMYERDISGYAAFNDSVVSVSAKFRKHYLLVTLYRCPAMESTSVALFQGSFTEFCGGGRDWVITRDGRCPIQSMYEFDDRQAAFDAHNQAEAIIQGAKKAEED